MRLREFVAAIVNVDQHPLDLLAVRNHLERGLQTLFGRLQVIAVKGDCPEIQAALVTERNVLFELCEAILGLLEFTLAKQLLGRIQ